jgi:acetyl-CoA carboxylase carboxyl transferase subunit beta
MTDNPGPRDPHFADDVLTSTESEAVFIEEPLACPSCGAELTGAEAFETFRVCPVCQRHFPIPARERLRLLVDAESFRETNAALVSLDPLVFRDLLPVPDRLASAAERFSGGPGSGVSEAILTGIGAIGGHDVVLVVLDHAYLGASIGPVAGEKILLAMELAAARRLPLIALCTAGGARTQEGLLGLIQAPKIAAMAARLHRAGVPFVSVLAHPATGAVWTALANQADIILAEPGARIGPGGRQQSPEQSETAEDLLRRGMLDGVVDRTHLRHALATLIDLFAGRGEFRPLVSGESSPLPGAAAGEPSAVRRRIAGWEEARLARHPERPSARDYLARVVTAWIELHGDRAGSDDRATIIGLGRIAGVPAAIVAGERGQPAGAGAFRKIARLLRLAGHLELPVISLVDTPGLDTGPDGDPAQTAAALASVGGLTGLLPVPVVAVIVGEAAGAAGVALSTGDRILIQEHAVYTVGGAEGIDRRAAAPLAASRTLTAIECRRLGVADAVIPEPRPAAHADPAAAARALEAAVATALVELAGTGPRRLLDDRAAKLRALGQTTPEGREAARREVRELQELQRTLARSLGDLRERLEERGLPRGLHLPTLPPLPGPVRDRVHIDTSALPSVERARAELVEVAVRLSTWRRSGSPRDADADLAPAAPRVDESAKETG